MDKIERGKRAELCIYDDVSDLQYDIVQFLEEFLGIQLLPYQKEMLKILEQYERIHCIPCVHCSINEIRRYKDGQTD